MLEYLQRECYEAPGVRILETDYHGFICQSGDTGTNGGRQDYDMPINLDV